MSRQAANFEAVLDLCAEYPCINPPKDYVFIPMLDMVPPESTELVRTAQEMQRLHNNHQSVLICCALGYGRSAAAMLVWLAVYGGCDNFNRSPTTASCCASQYDIARSYETKSVGGDLSLAKKRDKN